MCGRIAFLCKTKYQQKLTPEEEIECKNIVLKEKFPLYFYLFVLALEIVIAGCMIGVHIALIVAESNSKSPMTPLAVSGAG